MCQIDYADEGVLLLAEHDRVARKPHRCGECREWIAVGARYQAARFKNDDGVFAHNTCEQCQEYSAWLTRECGGYVLGGVMEDMAEHLFGTEG